MTDDLHISMERKRNTYVYGFFRLLCMFDVFGHGEGTEVFGLDLYTISQKSGLSRRVWRTVPALHVCIQSRRCRRRPHNESPLSLQRQTCSNAPSASSSSARELDLSFSLPTAVSYAALTSQREWLWLRTVAANQPQGQPGCDARFRGRRNGQRETLARAIGW